MANVNVTSNAWTEISITSGTVQNISATADIELSAEQVNNSGVVLKPAEIYQWDNETIYARAVTEDSGALRVVNFKKAAGGGGGYVLPVASASTLGGVKVGTNLSIDASGVLSATGGGGSFDIKSLIESNPTYYDRSEMFSSNKTTVTMPEKTNVNVGGHGYVLDGDTVDLTDSDNWDDSTYTTAANRAGKDFYIYLCQPTPVTNTTPILVLSANSTVPTGYTADNSRKIGGFHCLCSSVGTISGHALSGYVTGDILPLSVWDLKHRAISENDGMVYIPEVGKWVDIYLASWDGAKLVSQYNAIIADGESTPRFHGEKFAETFGFVNKQLPSRDDFIVFAKGSNEGTNISGSADPNTTGGHVDTNNRRMISNYGIEDCCGALLQWTNDCPENYPGATWTATNAYLGGYAWQTKPVYDSTVDSQSYGSCYGLLRRLFVGGCWGHSSYCGSRCVKADGFGALVDAAVGGRGFSTPRI